MRMRRTCMIFLMAFIFFLPSNLITGSENDDPIITGSHCNISSSGNDPPFSTINGTGTYILVKSNDELDQWALDKNIDGDGSKEDPYVIEDLFIDAKGAYYALYLENTTRHVIIRNCTLFNTTYDLNDEMSFFEIALKNTTNIMAFNNTFNRIKGKDIYHCSFHDNFPANLSGVIIRMYGRDLRIGPHSYVSGIYAEVDGSTIAQNQFILNGGIWVDGENNTISQNHLSGGYSGMAIHGSRNSYVISNTINNCNEGLMIDNSFTITLYSNKFQNCGIKISKIYGQVDDQDSRMKDIRRFSSHVIPVNNTVNDRPVIYLKDTNNRSISSLQSPGQIIICNSSMINVSKISISNTESSIQMAYANNVSIKNAEIENCSIGISAYNSSYLRLFNSTISSSSEYGIRIEGTGSGRKDIYLNTFMDNSVHVWDKTEIGNYSNPNGYGNYWDTMQPRDNNKDGINDLAFEPDSNLRDWYPLISPPHVPLKPPIDIRATNSSGYPEITWIHPMYLSWPILNGYRIHRVDQESTRIFEIPSDIQIFTDHEFEKGINYTYFIEAFNFFDVSPPSENHSIYIDTDGTVDSPIIDIIDFDRHYVNLSWGDPVVGDRGVFSHFTLMRGTSEDEMFRRVDLDPSARFFNDKQISMGQTYYYSLKAVLVSGVSNTSDIISIIPVGLPSSPILREVNIGDGYIDIHWSPPGDLGGGDWVIYRIYRGTNESELEMLPLFNYLPLSYNDTPLINGQTYFYEIFAENYKGRSKFSISFNATPNKPLYFAPPRNLSSSADDEYVRLEWRSPIDDNETILRGYWVYKGNKSFKMEKLFFTTMNVLIDRNVTNGNRYFYHVVAVYFNGESQPTDTIEVIPNADQLPLKPPSNFQLRERGEKIELIWSIPKTELVDTLIEFRIYRGDGKPVFSLLKMLNTDEFSYTDNDVVVNSSYYYFMTAVYIGGESRPSYYLHGIPRPIGEVDTLYPPAPPRNLTMVFANYDGIQLSWRPPLNADSMNIIFYGVHRKIGDEVSQLLTLIEPHILIFLDDEVDNETEVSYYVTAINPNGESLPSNTVKNSIDVIDGDDDDDDDIIIQEEENEVPRWVFYMIPIPGFIIGLLFLLFIRYQNRKKEEEESLEEGAYDQETGEDGYASDQSEIDLQDDMEDSMGFIPIPMNEPIITHEE
jgi:nitrous oxidase accessory protein NosD